MTFDVITLDGAEGLSGEDVAKLQALVSRSDKGMRHHLAMVDEGDSRAFMSRVYVGYGHESVADCADDVVFLEGVSHACAKAIQDSPLYNGVELSTRYVRCEGRPLVDGGIAAVREVQADWLAAYAAAYDATRAEASAATPGDPADKAWANAIHARACDVARGFLPVGSTTALSWRTTLRQFSERLAALAHHPLDEVRAVAAATLGELARRNPGTFATKDRRARDAFLAGCAVTLHYSRSPEARAGLAFPAPSGVAVRRDLDAALFAALPRALWEGRPAHVPLPRPMGPVARYAFGTRIDYGSFRDLARHRASACRVALVEGALDLHPWYASRLPGAARDTVEAVVARNAGRIERLRAWAGDDGGRLAAIQYAYPMGQLVDCRLDQGLDQAVYVAELRSSRHVHSTLRRVAHAIGAEVAADFPDLPLHLDRHGLDAFDVARGRQTVTIAAG